MLHNTYLDEPENLNGLLKKLRKIHNKIHKPVQKLMPKPLRKLDKKIESKIDKLAANKTLNKIGDVAAVAVGSYFFPPLASAAKSALVSKSAQALGKKYVKRKSEKEQQKLQKEIAILQKAQGDAFANAPEAVQNLPEANRMIIKRQVELYGSEGLKTPEALEAMKPAIVATAEKTAYNNFSAGGSGGEGQAIAAQAAAEQTEDRVDEAATRSFLKSNWPFIALFAGGAVLLYMNRSK